MSETISQTARWRPFWPTSAAGDLVGGFNAAMIGLPYTLGLGIAAFAPLGPQFAAEGALAGILGAICVGLFVPLLGGVSGMISGPRVTMVLVVSGALAQFAAPGSPFVGKAAVAAVFVMLALAGVFQFLFGIFRLGTLIKFIPYPVIAGIVSGSGLMLILGQARTFLDIPAGDAVLETLGQGVRPLAGAIAVGGATAAVAWFLPRRWPKLPGMFFAFFTGVLLHHALVPLFGPTAFGGTVGALDAIGSVLFAPLAQVRSVFDGGGSGLGAVFGHPILWTLLVGAVSLAVLASLDTLLGVLFLDGLTLRRSNTNRELAVHGMANILVAATGGLIGAGTPARTAVSFKAGGRSRLASIASALILLMLALVFPGALAYLPKSVVGGLLLIIGFELLDKWTLARVRDLASAGGRSNRDILAELGVVLVVVAAAVTLGLVAALAVGILIAVVVMIARLSRSLIRRVYRGAHVHSRRQRDRRGMETLAQQGNKIAVLELEGPIFFNSADQLETETDRLVADGARYVILDMKRVTEIDATGARTLENLYRRVSGAGVFVAFGYLMREKRRGRSDFSGEERRQHSRIRKVWLTLEQLGVLRTIGTDHVFPDTDAALGECENRILGGDGHGGMRDMLERRALAGVFRGFEARDIRILRRKSKRLNWQRGEAIFAEGDHGKAVYLLTKGRADVLIRVPGGERGKRVDTLSPGSVFGEMAVLDEKPRAAGIVAATEAAGYCIKAKDFAALKREHPQIALKILSNLCLIMSGRVRTANRMIAELEG